MNFFLTRRLIHLVLLEGILWTDFFRRPMANMDPPRCADATDM